MIIGIDHLVVAVTDPDAAAATLERELGLQAAGGGRHEALGTFNRLVWFGDSYLELIGVFDRALAAASWLGGPTLDALDAGDGFVTWALASDDLEGDLARYRADGATLDGPRSGERVRADGEVVRWRFAVPVRLGPARPPFLIEHDPMSAEWRPADRAARASSSHPLGGPVRLERLEIPVPDLAAAAVAFDGAGLAVAAATDQAVEARFGPQTVRLVERPDDGSSCPSASIGLSVKRPGGQTEAMLFGCRFLIESNGGVR